MAKVIENRCIQMVNRKIEDVVEEGAFNDKVTQLPEETNTEVVGAVKIDIHLSEEFYIKKQKEDTWNDFLSNITLHGFRYLFETKGMRRLIWIIFFCISLTSVILLFHDALGDYWQYKTYMVIKVEDDLESLDFPTLSMCHMGAYNRIKFKNFPFKITEREFHDMTNTRIEHISNKTYSKILHMPYEKLLRSLDLIANDTIFTGVAESMIKACVFDKKKCRSKDIIDAWTLYPYTMPCQQFNAYLPNVPSKSVSSHDMFYDFQIYLDTLASESMGSHSEHILTIHPHGMPGQVFSGENGKSLLEVVKLRRGYVNIINLDYIQINHLPPPLGKCGSEQFTVIKNYPYTKTTCFLDCFVQYAYKQCGCVRFDLKVFSTNIPICNTSQMFRCYNTAIHNAGRTTHCKCPPECVQHEYNIAVQRIPITLSHGSTQKREYIKENIVQIQVKYRKLERISKNVTASVTLTSLLGTVGGSIGLGLGFSLLTLVEFIMFIYDYMFSPLIRRIQVKKST